MLLISAESTGFLEYNLESASATTLLLPLICSILIVMSYMEASNHMFQIHAASIGSLVTKESYTLMLTVFCPDPDSYKYVNHLQMYDFKVKIRDIQDGIPYYPKLLQCLLKRHQYRGFHCLQDHLC